MNLLAHIFLLIFRKRHQTPCTVLFNPKGSTVSRLLASLMLTSQQLFLLVSKGLLDVPKLQGVLGSGLH